MLAPCVAPAADDLAPFLPDLLNWHPSVSLNCDQVAKQLWIAFGTGDSERSLERVMDDAALCASTWGGSSFRTGLYVDVLLSQCMAINLAGFRPRINRTYVLRVLENPPKDPRVREFRRGILRELVERPELRAAFERTYKRLYKLRIELQAIDTVGLYDSRVRRLFVLSLIRDLFVDLRDTFAGAQSGLHRIHSYAEYVAESHGFRHLLDLLDYEDGLALVQFQMRIGADGRVRKFEVTKVRENRASAFYRSPIKRMLSKAALWFMGYRVGESGLFDSWLEEVFQKIVLYLPHLFQLMADQEFYLAGLSFRDACTSKGLATAFPDVVEPNDPNAALYIRGLFNPLLFTQDSSIVTCDLDGAHIASKTILTGPNSGGKTRLLQAMGLTQVLGEVGLYAPVSHACIARANGLFVSLTGEDAVDQSEGRLGTELLRIRRLFESSGHGVLVILDELCSGTNPNEGEEIFRLVLSLLDELEARAVVATHFLDFARRLSEEHAAARHGRRLAFLQVQVGRDHAPTYKFCSGVAATSMARQIATRLGVTDATLRALVKRKRDGVAQDRSDGNALPPAPAAAPRRRRAAHAAVAL